ncbi:hypothetical protein FHU36_007838 [Nonomuraea muscovyensis]|uniref:Uncharacterized protein n=1 Tax=Nonomuraea muscovyensis TaxID=1124761 RepID=A0A7X0CBT3_9ACTN|nr:hypothetical protein [Nonomuraea muscovyensis]MBB6351255.1 hypothetical protein [Nonomuraea muscovyensis]
MPEESLDRLHSQQRAAKVLETLLARIANEGLPIITWTISSDASQAILTGTCDAESADQRRSDFEAWREALAATEVSDVSEGGSTRLRASVTDDYEDLIIALIAEA